jgi:diguanylate cyclase (GGDEF)-like protein/PAS domain S-box-containing protein
LAGGEVAAIRADEAVGEAWMTNRTELFEAALDSIPDGVALLGEEGEVVFWSRNAAAITGFDRADLTGRAIPAALEPLLAEAALPEEAEPHPRRGALLHMRHKLGHEVQAIARIHALHDVLGEQVGTSVVFHPAASLDALPHGEVDEGAKASQAELGDRLAVEFDDFARGGMPFGVLWIGVDQAHGLHQTHGAGACEAMLEKVERALAPGLRPAEVVGRWGDGEFLVVSHERTPEMLAAHAQVLAELARTADFRWWGDRISLTVSIGAAQADPSETLAQLLERAQEAMAASIDAGGNHITSAARGQAC